MKRYNHFCSYDGGGPAEELEDPAGDWVRYEDAVALSAERDNHLRLRIEFGDIISRHVIAMQAAVIDGRLRNPESGLQWIANTLSGPGHYPDVDEAQRMGGAQAWFDAKLADLEKFREEHPAPAPQAQPGVPTIKQIADIVREHLVGAYQCTRAWEAWTVGTMSQDDFYAAEEGSLAEDIAASIMSALVQATWAAPIAAPAPQAQPVAWAVFAKIDADWVMQFPVRAEQERATSDLAMYGGIDPSLLEVRPLYATPQPTPAPQAAGREPLTQVQIDEMKSVFMYPFGYRLLTFDEGVRAAERVHGIGAQQEGE